MTTPPCVWSIAGSDSSGGAGSQADQRMFHALGLYGGTVITAVTAQSLGHCERVLAIDESVVDAQLKALSAPSMPKPRAIKIGMLGGPKQASVVRNWLEHTQAFSVLDPVLSTTSGTALASEETTNVLRSMLKWVSLVTPNVPEAEALLGMDISSREAFPEAASRLRELGAKHVYLKGGHLAGELATDYYLGTEGSFWLVSPRIDAAVRGTGCTLASAIAGLVALGHPLTDSLVVARARIAHGIAQRVVVGSSALLGDLNGPLTAADLPWLLADHPAAVRPEFAPCGDQPLGFYPVVDRMHWVKRCVDRGVTTVQLRIKDLFGDELGAEVAAASAYCRQRGVRLFINDHWRLAIEYGAYGVHLGQEDLGACDISALAASGLRLGISTHSYAEAAMAHALQPSYVALGPVFATTSKDMAFSPQGMDRLGEWRRLLPYPLVAIGGLKVADAPTAIAAGADGVACISDVTKAADPDVQIDRWLAATRQRQKTR